MPIQRAAIENSSDAFTIVMQMNSTGFIRPMVDILEREAKKQGYVPDASVAGDEVIHRARPKPFMVYRNLDLMDISPIQSVVKVDDTVSGVGEALEAGCWGVGIARYSNYMNVNTLEEGENLSEDEIARRLAYTRDILQKSGAHYVIDTFDQLVDVIDDVNKRLARGEKP
jgi:phosphonoacetaldehyde hydrolase